MMTVTAQRPRYRGMTLIEVMVAIFIFAISATAILRSGAEHLRSTSMVTEISFATWVANNRLHEVMIDDTWPLKNNQKGQMELADKTWYWRQSIVDTADKDFKQIVIDVASDKAMTSVITSVSSYVAKPLPVKT